MSRTIVVTGVSSGIGKSLVELMGKEMPNDNVIALSRGALEYELPANVTLIKVDITKVEKLKVIISRVEKRFGGIDVLINNAGNGMRGSIEDTSLDEVREQMALNLWPPLALMQLVLPKMRSRRRGHIINVSSMAASIDYPTIGYYGAIKEFLEKISRVLEIEAAPWGIKVSCVEPGAVKTRFGKSMTNAKKYECSPYEALYKEWGQRFADLFKHPSSSEDAARVILKLIQKPKRIAFLRTKDKLAYHCNRLSRSVFRRFLLKPYIKL